MRLFFVVCLLGGCASVDRTTPVPSSSAGTSAHAGTSGEVAGSGGGGVGGGAAVCDTPGYLCFDGCSAQGQQSDPQYVDGAWQCPGNSAQLQRCAVFPCTRNPTNCCSWSGTITEARCDRTGTLPICANNEYPISVDGTCPVTPEACRTDDVRDVNGKTCDPSIARCVIGRGCGACTCECQVETTLWACSCNAC